MTATPSTGSAFDRQLAENLAQLTAMPVGGTLEWDARTEVERRGAEDFAIRADGDVIDRGPGARIAEALIWDAA